MINYYEILKITENASENDIKKAYKKLALSIFPDKSPNAAQFLAQIYTAYKILSNPYQRTKYDIARIGPIKNANLVGERTKKYVVPKLQDVGLFFVKQSFDMSQIKTKLPQEIYDKLNEGYIYNAVLDNTLVLNDHDEPNLNHNNMNNLECNSI